MSHQKTAVIWIGLLLLPGIVWAGFPDVPRSHWAHDAVAKVAQLGVVSAKPDGEFHGDKAATRYEMALGLARLLAEIENRLMAEGKNPEDIVPYIERINLFVADEIDALKQNQKEMRARLNEILERLDRRDGSMARPPTAPMAHPYKSTVPQTDLHSCPPVRSTQTVYPVPPSPTRMPDPRLGSPAIAEKTRIPSDRDAWQGASEITEEDLREATTEPVSVKNVPARLEKAFQALRKKASASVVEESKVESKAKVKSTDKSTSSSAVFASKPAAPVGISKPELPPELPTFCEESSGSRTGSRNGKEPTDEQLAGPVKIATPTQVAAASATVTPAPASTPVVSDSASAGQPSCKLSASAQSILQQLRARYQKK